MRLAKLIVLIALAATATGLQAAGDPTRGNTLYHATYGCDACHGNPGPNSNRAPIATTAAALLSAIQDVTEMRTRYQRTLGQLPADLDDIAAYLASFGAASATADVIEYYHANFDHYFITANTDEITKLDSGVFAGWVRTGYAFKAYPTARSGASAVCRFFSTSFAPKSSHFYTPFVDECALVRTNANWQYEGDVLYVPLSAADGTCGAGTRPVYRLYNNGQGDAPNHRYTADIAQRDQMLTKNWVLEGNGPGFAFVCAPS